MNFAELIERLRIRFATPGSFNPYGPMFYSYRHSDGYPLADRVVWQLRASGVPVWRDINDLLPGDTKVRLRSALSAGLSGGIIQATPDVVLSPIMRHVEVPSLLRFDRKSNFSLCVVNAIQKGDKSIDHAAPDQLLHLRKGTLSAILQRDASSDGVRALADDIVAMRMHTFQQSVDTNLVLDVQSRIVPSSSAVHAPLVMRTRPPEGQNRLPPPSAWRAFDHFLSRLPAWIAMSQADMVTVRGGLHLTMAFAIGAALPSTNQHLPPIEIEQRDGHWRAEATAPSITMSRSIIKGREGEPVAVYVDIHETPPPVNAFEVATQGHSGGRMALTPEKRSRMLPGQASATAQSVSMTIREFAASHQTTCVDLYLRTPFPVAVLLGREMNTLELTLFEWDNSQGNPRYQSVAVLRPGAPSPLIQVFDNTSTETG